MKTLSKTELKDISGGGIKKALATAFVEGYKYTSLTAALIVGITKGYYEEKNS